MAKMTKGTFMTRIDNGVEERAGYKFDLDLRGKAKHMAVYKKRHGWSVVDLDTGLSLCSSDTRKHAVARAESEAMREKFAAYVLTPEYGSKLAEFAELVNVDGDANAKAESTEPPAEDAAIAELNKRIEELEAQIKELEAAKSEKVSDMASTVSLSALLEKMQGWCEGKPNVSAYRKNEQPSTPIRIVGETKPYQDELNGLGFRWSRKGFWYYGPQEAEKQGLVAVA